MSQRLLRAGHADAEPDHRARHLVHVEGEVLAAHADLGLDHPVRRPARRAAAPAMTAVATRSLITGGTPRVYSTSASTPVPATTSRISCGDQVRQLPPGVAVEHPDGAADVALDRDRVGRLAGVDRAEDQARRAGARVHPAARAAPGTSTTTRPSACTRSAVRCGRAVWPPRPGRRTSTMSVAAVNGPERTADQAGRQLREAVQREDRRDVLEAALGDHLGRAGRELLLAGLEDQPHPAGQLTAGVQLGQRQAGAEQHRGVHVVPAGVADVRAPSTGTARPWCPAAAARPGRPGARSPGRPCRCRR